jgi:hypothetical protein
MKHIVNYYSCAGWNNLLDEVGSHCSILAANTERKARYHPEIDDKIGAFKVE